MPLPFSRFLLIAALALALTACAVTHGPGCADGEQAAIHDSLYFGTATPTGTVTPEQWAGFLQHTVTPRFPEGLTVSKAAGQWRRPDGEIVMENTFILQIVHLEDEASDDAIRDIVAVYKKQFQQESVLRVRTRGCASS